jgi:FlaA1/EpsC-like NDP-sugar epimerase
MERPPTYGTPARPARHGRPARPVGSGRLTLAGSEDALYRYDTKGFARALPSDGRPLNLRASLYVRKFAIDLAVWGLAPFVAFLIRFDGRVPADQLAGMAWLVGVGLAIKSVGLIVFRLNYHSWRHASFRDLHQVARAVVSVGVLEVAAGLVIHSMTPLARSVLPLSVLLGAVGLAGARAAWRLLHTSRERRRAPPDVMGRRALVVGAGEAGHLVVREMLRHPEAGLLPVAIVDDDPAKRRLLIEGVRVAGGLDDIPRQLRSGRVDQVVMAIGSADGALVRRVKTLVAEVDPTTTVQVLPGMYELLAGDVNVSRLREVQIEDLLRRPPVPIDLAPVRGYLAGRTVLVTGGGGSIGSELVRQLVQVGVRRVVALGHGEDGIYELLQGLARRGVTVEVVPVIADVRDLDRLRQTFARYRPEVVFHAAAHKHVPLMEANPEQAVLNNVEGIRNVVRAAREAGVMRLVNVSTDKAVNPSSVMGGSKRLAECVVKEAANGGGACRTYVSVRFGNVLGSRGSVIPLFRKQIAAGGPVTVTDPEMTRYFMTIPEAVQLVLQAGALAQPGSVYFLDMGQPVRIAQLAEDMIRLSGLRPHDDIEIVYTGVRPGEKMFEELTTCDESAQPTDHPKVFVTDAPDLRGPRLAIALNAILSAARSGHTERVVALLREAVPFAAEAAPRVVEVEAPPGPPLTKSWVEGEMGKVGVPGS